MSLRDDDFDVSEETPLLDHDEGQQLKLTKRFQLKIRSFIGRQYYHTNSFAWKIRGFIRQQYDHVNQGLWEIRSFFGRKLKHRILSLWKFWVLILIVVCVVGTIILSIDTQKRWTTADYPKLRYPSSSIRVLHIHPGSRKQRIECTMESLSFVNKPHYDALSYT